MPLKPYAPIPEEEPAAPDPERIAADNQAMHKAMRDQFGTATGEKRTILGNTWNVRHIGDPNQPTELLMRPDPEDPTRFVLWPNGQNPVSGVKPGGDQYFDQMQVIRNELNANGGENPLTGKRWGEGPGEADAASANYGQLRSMQQILHRGTFHPLPDQQVDAISKANDVAGVLRDIQTQYQAAGGKAGLNKLQQALQGAKTTTDLSYWLKNYSEGQDPQRDAYLKIMRDMDQLHDYGIQVERLSKDPATGAVANGLNDIFQAGGVFHPLVSSLAGGVIGGLKAVADGSWDNDALRAKTPLALASVDRSIYNTVSNVTQPAAKTLLKQGIRDMGSRAADDLYNNLKIGDGDDIAKVPVMSEPTEQKPAQPATQPTAQAQNQPTPAPLVIPGTKGLTIPDPQSPKEQQARASSSAAIKNAEDTITKRPIVQEPTLNQLPAGSGMMPGVNPIVSPAPLAPTQRSDFSSPSAIPQTQPRTPNDVWKTYEQRVNPAPLSQNGQQNGSYADNLPVLQRQEHVDSLESGTPFRWQDDDQVYVKT
jgi:hypothetical protein